MGKQTIEIPIAIPFDCIYTPNFDVFLSIVDRTKNRRTAAIKHTNQFTNFNVLNNKIEHVDL